MTSRLRLPDPVGRLALGGAALAWGGAAAGRLWGVPALLAALSMAALLVGIRRGRGWGPAVIAVAACLSGVTAAGREGPLPAAQLPEGPLVAISGVAATDPRPGRGGEWFLIHPQAVESGEGPTPWSGPALLVETGQGSGVAAGAHVEVAGRLVAEPGRAAGDAYSGRLRARTVETVPADTASLLGVANLVRARVESGLAAFGPRPAAALLSGFLIGDVRRLPSADLEAMRRAGLSHVVAVSGSNVALFLGLWWVVIGPLGRRWRTVGGLTGLALFVAITRWEPSVLRAAAMAALLLVARAAGWSISSWTALGAAVTALLLVSGELAGDAGFQLSVAATLGVMAGSALFPELRPRWVATTLSATVGAQVAVAPLLLFHFGSLPLAAPLTNLVGLPVVALATSIGGIGLLAGLAPLVVVAVELADAVLFVARLASPWPQLGVIGLVGALLGGLLVTRPGLRPLLALATAATVAVVTVGPGRSPTGPAAVFFDVGQGDASLLVGTDGAVVLIDGGPDPALILSKLAGRGVARIDLVILSHPHQDHVAGLVAVTERLPVGRIWHPGSRESGDAFHQLMNRAALNDIPVEVPPVGTIARLGDLELVVVGPLRRYQSPNDQSLVVLVDLAGTTVLFPGDIESLAQGELGPLPADVMKVPHQGSATSDLGWLQASAGRLAVVSVGPNDFGHPSPEVIAALEAAGAEVLRTDRRGDVVHRPR